MKHVKFTILLTVLMSMIGVKAFAHDFAVANDDGKTIYYKITGNTTVAVSYSGSDFNSVSNEYTGNIVIPESVTYNGTTYSVTSIAYAAFEYCSNLTSVTIPRSVTSIDKYAFSYIENLSSITIPTSVTTIGDDAFIFCSGLTSINVENGNPKYDSRNNCDAIIETSSNTLIAGCEKTVIPSSVKTIGRNAFAGCSALTSIAIPNSVTSILHQASWKCTNLTSITIPVSVTTIHNYAFIYSGLTSVTIPSSITCITDNTFDTDYSSGECNSLSVNIEVLDYSAFCNNEIIEKLTSNNSYIKSIHLIDKKGNEIKEYVIPENVTNIGDYAFYDCTGLTSVTIPNSVTNIGRSAFYGCSGLTSITIPASVTSIGEYAFSNCLGLTSVTIPNSVTIIGSSAFSGTAWYDNQPDGLVYAGKFAYKYKGTMPKNTSITIKEGTIGIVGGVFANCNNLSSVIIPNSVTSISDYAFSSCFGLTSVTVDIETPLSISSSTFSNRANATLYVPYGCKATYETADYWKEFKEIIEIPSPAIEFADAKVKALCVANWDTDGDGELSEAEATSVTDLGKVFEGNKKLTSFEELEYFTGLTSIGRSAFYGCEGLASITIPNSVTSIGNEAFYGCGLTSITIPNNVTTIGEDAFRVCNNLASITIGNGVTTIGDNAFSWCKDGIASIVVSSGNKTFDSRDGCNAIISSNTNTLLVGCKNTVIPNSVTGIGHAFLGCYGLNSITIPNSVTSIGDYAFCGCYDLISVSIPNSVTSIGDHAFYGYNKLTSITIPNSVTSIGSDAFGLCELTSVTVNDTEPLFIESSTFSNKANATLYVPYGCKTAYEAADYWKEFKEIVEMAPPSPAIEFADANVKAICVANWDTDGDGDLSEDEAAAVTSLGTVFAQNTTITSFDELRYFTGLTAIGDGAFNGCSGLASITLPDYVTSIGDGAFYGCSDLTSVTFDYVNSIGNVAFSGCSGLTSITIPSNVTSIGGAAFEGCSGLTSVTLYCNDVGDWFSSNTSIQEVYIYGSRSISNGAFTYNSGLTSVIIGRYVTSIGNYAFASCSSLTSITVDSENTKYDSRNNCNAIIETASNTLIAGCKTTVIPNSVTSIGEAAFGGSGLTSIEIPSSVTSIGNEVFKLCSGLTSIEIPNSVTSIGSNAFEDCSGLTSVTIGNSVESIGGEAFYKCSSLASITVDSENTEYDSRNSCNAIIETASNTLIAGCKTTVIPNSVTSIGYGAFYDCTGLSSIEIPNSVTSIGNYAFLGCSGLTSVKVEKESPVSITSLTFSNRANVTLYVPYGCKAAYEAADYWKEFKSIMEIGDADGDGSVDVNDVTSTINYILNKPVAKFIIEAADMDQDGKIDVNDVQAIIYKALGK